MIELVELLQDPALLAAAEEARKRLAEREPQTVEEWADEIAGKWAGIDD